MDPRLWKREHQLALAGSAVLGSVAGALLFALVMAESYYPSLWCGFGSHGWSCWGSGYLARITAWAAIGAVMGAAVIWIRQLLRA